MVLTREQVRELDRRAIEQFGVPGVVLMENAGRGMAELLRWILTTGQKKCSALGYAPLPAEVAKRALSYVDSLTGS